MQDTIDAIKRATGEIQFAIDANNNANRLFWAGKLAKLSTELACEITTDVAHNLAMEAHHA